MNVILIVAEDPFYTEKIVNSLLSNKKINIKAAIFPKGFINKKRIFSTFLIYGLFRFFKTVFLVLINNFFGGKIHNVFKKNNVKVFDVNNINDSLFLLELRELEPDIIISNNCPQRLRSEILKIPRICSINVHLGLLPKYRGVFPLFHAFIRNEKYFGVTVHYMNEKFDDGLIIAQKKVKICKKDNLFRLYEKAVQEVPELLNISIENIAAKKVKPIVNNRAISTYYSFPNFKEIYIYKKKVFRNF